jgi:hypothetical protein
MACGRYVDVTRGLDLGDDRILLPVRAALTQMGCTGKVLKPYSDESVNCYRCEDDNCIKKQKDN